MTTIFAERADTGRKRAETAMVGVLIALSASHMLNDVMQSLAPALYPVFRQEFALSFFQVGLITFVFQLTASFLQPVIGLSLDKRPLNWILPVGMAFTLVGLVLLAKMGDRVTAGQPLIEVHARTKKAATDVSADLLASYTWTDEAFPPPSLILGTVERLRKKVGG